MGLEWYNWYFINNLDNKKKLPLWFKVFVFGWIAWLIYIILIEYRGRYNG